MINYKFEGNIDFSKELFNLISKNEKIEEEEEVCLISGDNLKKDFVTLDCGHKFNYENIYNEIITQRKKNRLEIQSVRINQLKCPYCRSIHKGILPYVESYPRIVNVNCTAIELVKSKLKYCEAILKSGKRKGEICNCTVKFGKYCGRHKKLNISI